MNLKIVAGPTATGKTNFAVKLAKESNGELINADSRQIYKYLNIGTNVGNVVPVSSDEKYPIYKIEEVPIYLLQFLNPDEKFSVFDYKKLAEKTILEILDRGKQPILVGGTGLYIDAILKGYDFQQTYTNSDPELREELENKSVSELQRILNDLAPGVLANMNESDRKNPRRLNRRIELAKSEKRTAKGKQLTTINTHPVSSSAQGYVGSTALERGYMQVANHKSQIYYPNYNWSELKGKINERVEAMFANGLVNETQEVLNMGFPESSVALQGIGYREILQYLHKEISLEQCKELVKASHRQYARRQRTWFEGKNRNYSFTYF